MKTRARICEGIVIGVTAGIVLASLQALYQCFEYHTIRANQLEEVRDILYELIDGEFNEQVTSSAEALGTTHARLIPTVVSTLLSHESSHLTANERSKLAIYVHLLNEVPVTDDTRETQVALGALCSLIGELKFEEHPRCDEQVRLDLWFRSTNAL